MKKNILFILFVGVLAWAGTLTYTTTQVETAVQMTDTGLYTGVATITFTNGWYIACTSTNVQFYAP